MSPDLDRFGGDAPIDPTLVDNPLIFPAEGANVKVFRSLTPEEETKYTQDFQKVLGV